MMMQAAVWEIYFKISSTRLQKPKEIFCADQMGKELDAKASGQANREKQLWESRIKQDGDRNPDTSQEGSKGNSNTRKQQMTE